MVYDYVQVVFKDRKQCCHIQPFFLKTNILCSLLVVYKQIIGLTHACPVWGKRATSHLIKIQIFQNKVLRKLMTNAPWLKERKPTQIPIQIQEIIEHAKPLYKIFHRSLLYSSDSLYYNLHAYITQPQRRLKRRRAHDLLV